MNRISAIVLAAGSGERFGARKQFLELRKGFTLTDAALATVFRVTDSVILVLPQDVEWDNPAVKTVVGGSSRMESVAHGLEALGDCDVVVVHDAAHPLAGDDTIGALLKAIEAGADAAVPILPVGDVVKRLDCEGTMITVGRDGLGLAQVPMAFATEALRAAHQRFSDVSGIWEDSQLIERGNGVVVAVPGSSRNIHVLTEDDLAIARSLAQSGE